jgi:hypothetical protein
MTLPQNPFFAHNSSKYVQKTSSQGPAWDNFKKAHTEKSPQNGPDRPQSGPIRPHPSLHPLRGLPTASGGV